MQIQLWMAGVHSAHRGVNNATHELEKETASATSQKKFYLWKPMVVIVKKCLKAHTPVLTVVLRALKQRFLVEFVSFRRGAADMSALIYDYICDVKGRATCICCYSMSPMETSRPV